jgi:hypothetical protein
MHTRADPGNVWRQGENQGPTYHMGLRLAVMAGGKAALLSGGGLQV